MTVQTPTPMTETDILITINDNCAPLVLVLDPTRQGITTLSIDFTYYGEFVKGFPVSRRIEREELIIAVKEFVTAAMFNLNVRKIPVE